jgi:hypothetical protein
MAKALTRHQAASIFLRAFGIVAVIPGLIYLLDQIKPRPDEGLLFDLGACAAMLILLLVLLVDFDTDGVLLWWSDVMTRVNRWPLGTWLGVTLKILAVLHGLAAVISGACLTMDHEANAGVYRFWPQGWNSTEMIAIVVWLWVASVLTHLGGDCYIAESRRKTPRQEGS